MKRKILFLLAVVSVLSLGVTGCQKITTEGMSKVSTLPTITIKGGTDVFYLGETYVDTQGCIAKDAEGNDISDRVVYTHNILNRIGVYTVTYTVKNDDGAPAHAYRRVYAVNTSTTSVANVYLAECIFNTDHYKDTPIVVSDNGDGSYFVEDLLGGLQFNGINKGLDPPYDLHAEGYISVSADYKVSQEGETGEYYFGASRPVSVTGGTFDPSTGILNMKVNYGAIAGEVILRPITK